MKKKYGIVLPTWAYNPERLGLAGQGMQQLSHTEVGDNKPVLLIIHKPGVGHYYEATGFAPKFHTYVVPEIKTGACGTEQTLAWGTEALIGDHSCDYVTWMGDDAAFHPQWHMKLRKLIEDKPDALGWSVYRSAYERFHQTLFEEGDYVNVSTLCGHGMTISKEEWKIWGIDWKQGYWPSPAGNTLDLKHAFDRTEPNRWTTRVSYIDHVGRRGVHCTPDLPEYAVNFQGTV